MFVYVDKVFFGDTDAFGVVYYARYLYFLEKARMEFLESIGFAHKRLENEYDRGLIVSRVEMEYKAPLKLGDEFTIELFAKKISSIQLLIEHKITRKKDLINIGKINIVSINKAGRPKPLPKEFLNAIN